jgi:hypothetical protein
LIYATTALSHHIQGRYKPVRRWARLLDLVTARLTATEPPVEVEVWTQPRLWAASGEPLKLVVRSPAKPEAGLELVEVAPGLFESVPSVLPDGEHTFVVGEQTATVLVGSREERYQAMVDRGIEWFDRAGMFYAAPDGSKGVAQGFSNEVTLDGSLPFRPVPRGDCYTQVAHAYRMTGTERGATIATNLMRPVVEEEQLTDRNPLYGAWEPRGARTDLTATNNLFADDNGWISLFALVSGHLEPGLRGVESLIRTANDASPAKRRTATSRPAASTTWPRSTQGSAWRPAGRARPLASCSRWPAATSTPANRSTCRPCGSSPAT